MIGGSKLKKRNLRRHFYIYCAEHGKWIKWLSKDEVRVLKHRKLNYDQKIYDKTIRGFSQKLMSRLPDAIYAKAVESMVNLTNNKKGTRNGPFFIFT